jgi:hypothetical protein
MLQQERPIPISITSDGDRYRVVVSPPEGPHRRSSESLTATDVLAHQSKLGCHSTDITDALYAADPEWSAKHNAHLHKIREAQSRGLDVGDNDLNA